MGVVVHRPVAEIEVPAGGQIVVVDLRQHPEGRVSLGELGLAGLPLLVGRPPLPGQLHADSFLEVLRGVDPVPVEPELPHPVREPLHDVVAGGAGVAGAVEEVVQLRRLHGEPVLLLPLLHEEGGKFDGRVGIGTEIGEPVHQLAGDRRLVVPEAARGFGPDPAVGPSGVPGRHGPRVVDDRVHDHPDAPAMGLVHNRPEVLLGSQGRVHPGPVPGPVAVVSVGGAGAFVDLTRHLLHEGGHPDGRHPQCVEPPLLELLQDAPEISAFEPAQDGGLPDPLQGAVVPGVAVPEPVRQEEIDGPAVPLHLGTAGGPGRRLPGCARRAVASALSSAPRQEEHPGQEDGKGTPRSTVTSPRPAPHVPAGARPSSRTGSSRVAATSSRSSTRRVRSAARISDKPPTRRA